MKVDNYALTMFQSCPAKYDLRIRQKWTSRRKSGALGFGGALHEGLAAWYRTHDRIKALKAMQDSWPMNLPIDDWRTKEKCAAVLLEYMKVYAEENFQIVGWPDNPLVECTFTIDTGMFMSCIECRSEWTPDDGPVCGCGVAREAIEYGGIFDGLVQISGVRYVLEHKTTSQLGSYYFDQYKPNNQVTGYVWAANQLSGTENKVTGAIINAIGIYKASATKFERQITSRSDDNIKEWLTNVRNTCEMIRECEMRQHWPMFTPSCVMYGKCEFHQVHTLGTFNERQKLLEQDFVKDEWKYEERAGVKAE